MDDFWDEPVCLPITGELDLHTFKPADVGQLLPDYIEECRKRGILEIRVIHGKGKGILKKRVEKILATHPRVKSFWPAPEHAGGWGATIASLEPYEQEKNR